MAKKDSIWIKDSFNASDVFPFNEDYKAFLSRCKTERECVSDMTGTLKAAGAHPLEEFIASGTSPKPNDLVYTDIMGKSLVIFRIGKKNETEGMRILGAHIDSPRLDLKQNPLYEDSDLAFFDTHYYGGIKKYQWVTLPLAIHGIVAKKDGSNINIVVGEDPSDPVLGITDILPHLGRKQQEKKLAEAITGEGLNLLIGSMPCINDENTSEEILSEAAPEKEASSKDTSVKANILRLLKDRYDIEEDDFVSAELEVVPAGPARDFGLDRSLIMSYGQDDRVCAYTSFRAILDTVDPDLTSVCLLTDKEEIGSVGATGMHSRFFEDSIAELMDVRGCFSELNLRRALRNSKVLSSDVNAAFDPLYPEVMEKNNCAYLGLGPVFSKYTGSRGKSGSNDANAEYIAFLRRILDDAGVSYQTAELGKVDEGGGGTIAYIMAKYGMEVIDFGVALLSMHAPYEISSKVDVYETYRAYTVFLSK